MPAIKRLGRPREPTCATLSTRSCMLQEPTANGACCGRGQARRQRHHRSRRVHDTVDAIHIATTNHTRALRNDFGVPLLAPHPLPVDPTLRAYYRRTEILTHWGASRQRLEGDLSPGRRLPGRIPQLAVRKRVSNSNCQSSLGSSHSTP